MNNLIKLEKGVATVAPSDPWILADADSAACVAEYSILPLERWLRLVQSGGEPGGLLLDPDADPAVLVPWLDRLRLIALQFPSFRDGRAYSQAFLLRSRLGFSGDLRATGDVLRDQLAAMRHCGFSSFAVREDRPAAQALKGLSGFDMIYARSVTSPQPLFRRRQTLPDILS